MPASASDGPPSSDPPSSGSASADPAARADSLRDGTDAERAEAARIYLAQPASFDPSSAEGRARLLWLLRARRADDPACLDAVERATRSEDEALRRAARTARGMHHARRGDADLAEEHFLAVLREPHAASPDADDLSACLGLSWMCRSRLREFEALVFARRAQIVAEALDDAVALADCLLHLAACRMELDATAAAERTFDQLEAMLPSLPHRRAVAVARRVHTHRADVALRSGHGVAARRQIDAWAALDASGDVADPNLGRRIDAEARLALLDDRPSDALALLDRMPRRLAPVTTSEFDIELRRAEAIAAIGRGAAFVAVAEPLLAHLLAHGQRLFGGGRAFVFASDLGRLANECGGPVSLAARAHEFAARMALARLGELESAARRLDLADVLQEHDRHDLARYRAAFADRHQAALQALSADFSGVPAEAVERLAGFVHGDGAVRVCAWCLMAWLPDGRTAPAGHILQSVVPDAVTHGICPPCLAHVRRGGNPPVWDTGRSTEL